MGPLTLSWGPLFLIGIFGLNFGGGLDLQQIKVSLGALGANRKKNYVVVSCVFFNFHFDV